MRVADATETKRNLATTAPLASTPNLRAVALFLFLLSGVVSVLALNGAIYMLQIYDRALTGRSVPTLAALSALALGLYAFHGALDIARTQIIQRIGARFDLACAPKAHRAAIDLPRSGQSSAEARERQRDVDVIRQFLSSQGPAALFDLPWAPLFLAFVYMLHPWLGLLAGGGAIALLLLAGATALLTRRQTRATQASEIERSRIADSNLRNAETLQAMGLAQRAVARFEAANTRHLRLHAASSGLGASLSGVSRTLRMALQSAVLGLGAYLTIQGEMTAGMIIAASVAASRALAPVDSAISHWKLLAMARRSHARLAETLGTLRGPDGKLPLPRARRALSLEELDVAPPGGARMVLSGVNMTLDAGSALAVVGPSGGGKSALARAIVGVWPAARGTVRLDNADLSQMDDAGRGAQIGYLPQDVSLFDATIAENIARLDPDPDPEKVLAAAQAAGVHDLILRLPDGYQTELGPQGAALSAGQRQRIALARALYGDPFLVVLDEPNSNLDRDGDLALGVAIEGVKARGGVALVVTHRPSGVAACDMFAVIEAGALTALGPKEDVLGDLATRRKRKAASDSARRAAPAPESPQAAAVE